LPDIGAVYFESFRRYDQAVFENRTDFAADFEELGGGGKEVGFFNSRVFAVFFSWQYRNDGRIIPNKAERLIIQVDVPKFAHWFFHEGIIGKSIFRL